MSIQTGLQLYSVRRSLSANWQETLEKCAEMGYRRVQLTTEDGYAHTAGNASSETLRACFDRLGIHLASLHVKASETTQWDRMIAFAQTLDCDVLIVPMGLYTCPADIERMANRMNRWMDICDKAGMRLYYHNHVQEFRVMDDGKTLLQHLLSRMDPRIKLELDAYWAVRGGTDPAAWIRELGSRCDIVHLKDLPRAVQPVNVFDI